MLFIVLIVLFLGIFFIQKGQKSKESAAKKFSDYILKNNISVTNFVDISEVGKYSKFIVDEKAECIYLLSTDDNMVGAYGKKISFKDVIKCELIKDSKTKLVEDRFSILENYNKKEYVKKLGIRITINDLSLPYVDILFLNSLTGQTLFGLGHIVDLTNQWISIITVIVERGKEIKNNEKIIAK